MVDIRVIDLDQDNVAEHGLACIVNPEHAGYQPKLGWFKQRLREGLKIKVLKNGKVNVGFIEYIPGEFAWRPVKAEGYMFIHCLWVYAYKYLKQGYGSLLLQECLDDAMKKGMSGVAAVTSEGPWMVDKRLFLKNGFESVVTAGRFELLVRQLKEGTLPKFNDWDRELGTYEGWNLVYARQCPMIVKSIDVLSETAEAMGVTLKIRELKNAREAQNAPSGYGVFGLIHDGRLVADHYISKARLLNILKKESR